jgi:Ca2+-binding RTX toxin-like protein
LITNSGTIAGRVTAIDTHGYTANDRVINTGLIEGNVSLGGGADFFDTRLGRVNGVVSGGDGNDTYRPGAGQDVFDGDTGNNFVDFLASGAVTVALDRFYPNTGDARGDVYHNIFNIRGSATSSDRLRGDEHFNQLYGRGGNDILTALDGNDTLVGGVGHDRLAGGAGADAFVFYSPAEGGDTIIDFNIKATDTDGIQIVAAGFGAGLFAGDILQPQKFRARIDNHAQDADDRLILRTTDNTLWFDSNGSAPGGLTLIADLQAGAHLTASDILLI